MEEAKYYSKLKNDNVICKLCPHFCIIKLDQAGLCKVRKNIKGKLFSLNYGKTIAFQVDPIEKKPLYHFYPGKKTLSLATTSCNFKCKFCQNHQISQHFIEGQKITPDNILQYCLRNNIEIVSFTYTEPTIWFEFILDAAKILKKYGIKIVLVTNGFINPEPLKELASEIDAMNIDLKSMNEDFYKNICSGEIEPVKKTIQLASINDIHLEITFLLITGENDDKKEFLDLINFIKNIDENIPLHISRYFPTYKIDKPATSSKLMTDFYYLSKKYLTNVYLGNMESDEKNDTFCPNCNKLLIKRGYYQILENNIIKDKCKFCGQTIFGRF